MSRVLVNISISLSNYDNCVPQLQCHQTLLLSAKGVTCETNIFCHMFRWLSPWCYKVLQRRTSINPGLAPHAARAPWLNSFSFSQAQRLTVPRTHREESPFPLCNAILVQGLVWYADLTQANEFGYYMYTWYTDTFCENVNYFLCLCKQRKRQFESSTSCTLVTYYKNRSKISGNDPQSHKPHPLQREEGSSHVATMKVLPRLKLAVTNEICAL